MTSSRYDYRLGWRSLRTVVGGKRTTQQWKDLAHELGRAMQDYGITNSKRAAMFIAQLAHESGGFIYREEIASGQEYEGRADLGNTHPGDGRRYKGRSYIQITGRSNYAAISKAMNVDFVSHPTRLAEPAFAAKAAAWWWHEHGLNALADSGDFVAVTRRINGGINGLSSREAYYRKARLVAKFITPARRAP